MTVEIPSVFRFLALRLSQARAMPYAMPRRLCEVYQMSYPAAAVPMSEFAVAAAQFAFAVDQSLHAKPLVHLRLTPGRQCHYWLSGPMPAQWLAPQNTSFVRISLSVSPLLL